MEYLIFLSIEAFLVVLAAIVFGFGRKNIAARYFALFVILIAIWQVANFSIDEVSDLGAGLLLAKMDYAFGPLMALALWYFSYYFPQPSGFSLWINRLFLLAALLLSGIVITTPLVVQGVMFESGHIKSLLGHFELVFLSFVGFLLLASIVELWRKFRRARGVARTQLKFVFLGLSLGVLIAGSVNLIAPIIYGDQIVPPEITRLSFFGIVAMVGLIAYAILTHRLFDIRVIIKRTVIFTGLSLFTLSTYAVIVFILTSLFGGRGADALSLTTIIPNLVAAIVIAVTFDPLRRWLTNVTDAWLFKGEYKQEEVLKNLSLTLANVIDIDEAIKGMIHVVVEQMRLTRAVVFMLHPNGKDHEHELRGVAKVGEFDDDTLKLAPQDILVEYFEEMGIDVAEPVVTEELERIGKTGNPHRPAFIARAHALGASVLMPLIISRQEAVPTAPGTPAQTREVKNLIGILALGAKKSGDTFSDQDMGLLQIVANETAAAIEKGRFFEEDRLKTEFVSIASHELLTPTTSMKGYLSMILDEGIGKVDPTARKYLDKVYTETNRLAALVKDLLNVSRIERGKIMVEPKPQELWPLLAHAVETQELKAKERKLTLTLTAPKKALPLVSVDAEKLLEVFINVVGNGLKYTKQGGVSVTAAVQGGQVAVAIADTGIGIGPNDLQHLFGKFFRASNSDETGQTGTGLGLYISKYVTELMGGTITVDSAVGKGTTFTVLLPVASAKPAAVARRTPPRRSTV